MKCTKCCGKSNPGWCFKCCGKSNPGWCFKGKDLDHNFPSSVDSQADAAKVGGITGGDGILRTKVELPGDINGKEGNFTWIIEPDKTINHRQFERARKQK